MKKLFIAFCLLYNIPAHAQEISLIQYTIIDSIRYAGEIAPLRRSADGEIQKYMAAGGKNFDVAHPLMVLESDLDNALAYLQKGERKITWTPHMRQQLQKIRKVISKFPLAEYEQEIKIYESYNAVLEKQERQRFANIDSVRKAYALEKERKRLAEEAAIRNKNKKNQQNQDSLKKSFAAMMALAADNEAKAQREYLLNTYGRQYGTLIADGMVKPGMNKEMCTAALGVPRAKTKPDANDTSLEVWEYRDYNLKFKDDKLVTVEDK